MQLTLYVYFSWHLWTLTILLITQSALDWKFSFFTTLPDIHDQFWFTDQPNMHVVGLWEAVGVPRENPPRYRDRVHPERLQLGLKLGTILLWGINSNCDIAHVYSYTNTLCLLLIVHVPPLSPVLCHVHVKHSSLEQSSKAFVDFTPTGVPWVSCQFQSSKSLLFRQV